MSWRSWSAHTLLPCLALVACARAVPSAPEAGEPQASATQVAAAEAPALREPGRPAAHTAEVAAPAAPLPASPEPEAVAVSAAPRVEPVAESEPEPEPAASAPQESTPEVAPPAEEPVEAAADDLEQAARNRWLDDPRLEGMFVFDRGPGKLPVAVAREEQLVMSVRVKFAIGSPKLGTVTLISRVVPHRGSVLVRDAETNTKLERAELLAVASGGNALYNLVEERKSLLLPQPWPHLRHTSVQTGTECRKREQDIGWGDAGYYTHFRNDHHCGGCQLEQHFVEPTWAWQDPHHCKKCKRAEHRVWNDWRERSVPEDTVDMVTAVMLGRSMMLLGEESMTFPLIDEEKLWELTIRRGPSRRIEVDAGEFDATEILLSTKPWPGEDAEPGDFKGLFGIHGTVSIWFDTATGVPVQISGVVPLGPFTLDASVELDSYRGTPAGFAPVK